MTKQNDSPTYKNRIHLILYFLQGSKRFFGLAILFVCMLVLFELIDPKIIGYTVDFVIGNEEDIPAFLREWVGTLGGREYVLDHLWIFSGVVIGFALLGALCRYFFQLFNSMGAEHLVKRMRDTLYGHIARLPYSWQDSNKTGDIIQRCTSDVDMIKNFLSEQLTNLFRMIVMIALALYFMGRIHLLLTLVASVFIPIMVPYCIFFRSRIRSSFEKIDTEEGRLSAIAQENLTGVRVVRAFGREKYERDRFEKKNEEYTGLWVTMMQILSNFWRINDIICAVQVLTILSLGAYFTICGEMSAGDYVAYMSYNGLLIFPVRQLGRVISDLGKAGISIDRIMYIMNAKEEGDAPDAVDYPGNGDIVFDHVSFGYKEGTEVLKDVSFTIKKGQTVGILGPTGSGKSTLVHLLDALYELPGEGGQGPGDGNPVSGSISINNVDIRRIRKSQLRSHIGIVLQEPYLFSRSIRENIRIAREDAGRKEIEQAVEMASLTESIERFTDGYDTYVGERGVTLSGGQKQRTAIAQMLVRRPDIMIFDDSLSAVDAKTDANIRQRLKAVSKGTTTLLISHRVTTLMHADLILVLQDGMIKEQGTHEELVAKNGRYRKIFDLQGEVAYE